jgi:hypothetical protein
MRTTTKTTKTTTTKTKTTATMTGAVLLLALVGCGSSGDPTVHSFLSNDPNTVPAGQSLGVGPFTLPSGATVSYSVVDTPTGIGNDSMDVGVVTDASFAGGGQLVAYGLMQGVSSTSGATPPLPADDYDLLVQCRNVIDDCIFNLTVSATY